MRFFTVFLLTIHFCSNTSRTPEITWTGQQTGTLASLRGLCVVDTSTAWASGSGGSFLRTTDGGDIWNAARIPGYEALDFRDVHAFSADEAVLLSAGTPTVILRTGDGGKSWTEIYRNDEPAVFFIRAGSDVAL